jgi:hypothetical protein
VGRLHGRHCTCVARRSQVLRCPALDVPQLMGFSRDVEPMSDRATNAHFRGAGIEGLVRVASVRSTASGDGDGRGPSLMEKVTGEVVFLEDP